MNKKQIWIVTPYGRNKNLDEIKKNQDKANNNLSYRFAAIKQRFIQLCFSVVVMGGLLKSGVGVI